LVSKEELLDLSGVLVVDKPSGWTSHDVVNKVRRLLCGAKVGHLGTLDPMATGVLPLVIGKATRLAQFYGKATKAYEAEVTFGYATDSYDADGQVVGPVIDPKFEAGELQAAIELQLGERLQVPPPVSAKKVNGQRAYDLAREGKPVELKPVFVVISQLQVTSFQLPKALLLTEVSSGTYVRAISHQLGRDLGCGATLTRLRRVRSGDFEIGQSTTLEAIESSLAEETTVNLVLPMAQMLPEIPAVRVDEQTAGWIRQGRNFHGTSPHSMEQPIVRALDRSGNLLAIGKLVMPGLWHPELVL
jgi:tRNA pseudouridine55 synthase